MRTAHGATAHMGWQELLPAGARGRVLCLDVGNGQATLALAQMYDEVVSVPLQTRDVTALADVVGRASASHVTVLPALRQEFEGAFDGLVAVLFGSECSGARPGAVRALVREAAERIGDGFVVLAAANALACSRPPGRGFKGFLTWGARGLESVVTSSGREHTRSWPVLLSEDAPFEVLHGPYRSPSGSGRGTERIKEVVLGVAGARWFAPGYVTLGQRRESALVVDELLENVDLACGGESRVRRHLAKRDKTLLVTDTGSGEPGRVVVLPHTPRALSLRSHEAEILRAAQTLPPRLRRLFPGFQGDGRHDGQDWLALEHMPGIFVDEPVADLDQITERAADLLVDLHLETRREVHVDEVVYGALVGSLVASARRRNPWCAELLAQIDLQLRAELLGRNMPQVWMHGDYKIENVGIDKDSRHPVAVIDWELAQTPGLPLIDLKYLLVYNRMLRGSLEFDVACLEVADGTAWSDGEKRTLDQYAATIGLDADLRRILRVLFIIHAGGARLQYDGADPAERSRLSRLLAAGSAQLKCDARGKVGGAA